MTAVDAFVASAEQRDIDMMLAPYDCWGTAAHVRTLQRSGVVDADAMERVLRALRDIDVSASSGQFAYDSRLGAQLSLEKLVVGIVGEDVGYRVHTGRSRNDQVVTAQRLHLRDTLVSAVDELIACAATLIERAASTGDVVMPGYTHMQPARPTSFGQWCAAHADLLLRDLERLQSVYRLHNRSPLGAAESYGTSWPLDREYTARLLAFDGVEEIPLFAVGGRGEAEADTLHGITMAAIHLSRLAQDLLLFTTFEYGFAELGADAAIRMGALTGSSIMPQKRNPDVLELVRALPAKTLAALVQSLDLMKGLPLSYNRDSRESKGLVMPAATGVRDCARHVGIVISDLVLRPDRMRAIVDANYSMATELAEHCAQVSGIPYRTMYRIVGEAVDALIRANRPLAAITAKDLAESAQRRGVVLTVSDADVERALDPVAALERRNNEGGASRSRMATWVAARRTRVGEHRDWCVAVKNRHAVARREAL